ncbi:MAG: ATP-binding protein [Thermoanaerobaculia bacterium]
MITYPHASRRKAWLMAAPFLIALVGLLIYAVATWSGGDPDRLRLGIERGYATVWQDLDRVGERAVSFLERPPSGEGELLVAFQGLSRIAEQTELPGLSIYLLDPQGSPTVWAGEGLVHDLEPQAALRLGRTFLASFSSVSLMSVKTLGGASAGWRLVSGSSFSVDGLPFSTWSIASRARYLRWTLLSPGKPSTEDLLRIDLPDTPALVVDIGSPQASSWWRSGGLEIARIACLVLGLLLLTQAGLPLLRSDAAFEQASPVLPGQSRSEALLAGGLMALMLAGGAAWWAIVAAPAGMILASLGLKRAPLQGRPRLAVVVGVGVSILLLALAIAVQCGDGPSQIGRGLGAGSEALASGLALFSLAFGLLSLTVGGRKEAIAGTARWAWLALAALVVAGASQDLTWVASGGLVVAGAATGAWCWNGFRGARTTSILTLAVLAAVTAAVSWQIADRICRLQELELTLLPATALPTEDEMDGISADLAEFFIARNVEDFSVGDAEDLGRRDLAFEVWHQSPLASHGALSALTVESPEGWRSTFSFGLPMGEEGDLDPAPTRWESLRVPGWDKALLGGDGFLLLQGKPWARVHFWLALRPGFRLEAEGAEDLAAGLLRGGPTARGPAQQRLESAIFALYDPTGSPLVTSWPEAPRLEDRFLQGGRGVTRTPDGPADVAAARDPEAIRALLLPRLGPLGSLEKVGLQVVDVVAVVALLALLVVLPGLRWRDLRLALRRTWRSYSKRLLLVYALLLLVPLLLMNALVVRLLEERLQVEQQAAGRAALESAQQVLGEYILSLQPGFGIDAALDDELLIWLSSVVHHEVNLYWRSNVYASSKPELFTAGFLPKRIPGEMFSRLTLLGHEVSSRVNRAGGAEYLELYAPLTVPGVPLGQSRLFLSIPLLAQQEETEAEIGEIRRAALLGMSILLLVVAAVGGRLARGFTNPLMEIVEGTQRIAGGETSLRLKPTELELATLVDAIDRMAGRIAEGRRQILREKDVVEMVVDNITAGVVSLDAERRVLTANRVAGELLACEVGSSIEETLASDARLEPISTWLRRAGDGLSQETVHLEDRESDERQEWSLVWAPLPGPGEPSALLVVEDVTEVLRGQRLQAWAEMARMIAHEIKNPLTPIRLSAEHLREVYANDPDGLEGVFESCTNNILKQVGELQEIASEFSTYSKIPKMNAERTDLRQVVSEVVDAYRTAPPRGVEISFVTLPHTVNADLDARLVSRALRNLIENALNATPSGGRVEVRIEVQDGQARISVADDGPGVEPETLPRIFEPYFSTHDSGTGLGLPIACRIVEEHHGAVTAHNRQEGGLEVTISLPVASD